MSTASIHSQTLALAGVLQAAAQVHDIANTGQTDQQATIASLRSVLRLSAESVQEAIGKPSELRYGLRQLQGLFSGNQQKLPALQYAMLVMQLEQSFRRDKHRQQALAEELALINRHLPLMAEQNGNEQTAKNDQLNDNDAALIQPEIVSQLANAWSEQVRVLKPQIAVQGKPLYLQNDNNVHLIRALLLSALRSAWLWQQLGGRRWQLIFKRKRILQAAKDLLLA